MSWKAFFFGTSDAANSITVDKTPAALWPMELSVAALMFRFNNPDALLVLAMAAAAYGMTRASEEARTKWLVLAGGCLGVGFLARTLQVLLVVPGFALVFSLAVARVQPASYSAARSNSNLEPTLGYNGCGRLSGNETGSVRGGGPGGTGGGIWGRPVSRGSSAPRSADRSPGCCRPRCCSSRAGWWRPCAPRGPTAYAPPSCSGAAGSSGPAWSSAR